MWGAWGKVANDTVVARMSKLVEEASSRKSRAQRFIDNFSKYYIPVVALISASIAVVPVALGVPDIEPWFHLAIVVLLSGCPCALILSTPVAVFCALTKAAISGLLPKGGDYLETLSGIEIVAFDKTGTITRGEFSVTNFCAVDDISIETLLYWVSSIESKSSHPMAAALVEYGLLHSIKPVPENVENFQNFPGAGISGTIDEIDVYIGNRRIAVRAGCERVNSHMQVQSHETSTQKQCCEPTLVGVFCLVDACRSGALEAIEELNSLGVRSAMLTGDSAQVAKFEQSQCPRQTNSVDCGYYVMKFMKDIITHQQLVIPTKYFENCQFVSYNEEQLREVKDKWAAYVFLQLFLVFNLLDSYLLVLFT
ncbi:cadmium/zinc-transporting ATPase HMA2-like [Lotus japonicus]|uniref:cadmium/zinc-transporting ATPase HMA2-like n=1 Tax=Lotus japonicus TaxID=34305 RepID=UPI00258378B0|nr:cadmium/zinc-transporting ATPase HMA2-like [Lotus japonicus]